MELNMPFSLFLFLTSDLPNLCEIDTQYIKIYDFTYIQIIKYLRRRGWL